MAHGVRRAEQIAQDQRVVLSGEGAVRVGIEDLHVVEQIVGHRQHGFEVLQGRAAAGVQRRGDAFAVQTLEKFGEEFILQERLAARAGHAAAELLVVGSVAQHLAHKRVHGIALRLGRERFGGTGLAAAQAGAAGAAVDGQSPVGEGQRAGGAGVLAAQAADAGARVPPRLVARADALGVLAPAAAQRAALDEHGRAHAGAVVGRAVGNVDCQKRFVVHSAPQLIDE